MTIDLDFLLHMNGHGAYVWGGYAAALALLGAEAVALLLSRRRMDRRREQAPLAEERR